MIAAISVSGEGEPRVAPPAALPATAALASTLFGDRLPLAVRYVEWLAGAGVERGLIGPRETDRLWDRHLLNCVAVAALIPPASSVVDVGSGAGLPGIALAIARPDLHITLAEPMLRRTTFLEVVVADLGLEQVQIRRARAEELKRPRLNADVVTARAVAPIDRLAGLAAPLLRAGGRLLALKGGNVLDEVDAGWPGVRRAAMADGARLFAVKPAADRFVDGRREVGRGWLPGVDVLQRAAWSTDGSRTTATETAANHEEVQPEPDAEALALILQLQRSIPGISPTRDSHPARGPHKAADLV